MPTVPITIIGTITDGEATKQVTINGLASVPLVDPGYGIPIGGRPQPPSGPVDPGYSPPWAQIPVDPGYGYPIGGKPHPEHPIVLPPTEPPPTQPPPSDSGHWTWAWSPQAGRWVWVKVPGEGEAGPKSGPTTGAAKPA